jgi:glutathione S-transferase
VLRYRPLLLYCGRLDEAPLLALLVVNRLGILGRARKGAGGRGMLDKHLDWLETELAERRLVRGRRVHGGRRS